MLWWCSKVHFHSSSSPQSVLQYTNARHWRSSPPLLGVSSSARIAAAVRVINMSEDESRIWWDSVCLSLQRIRPICCTTWPWMLSLLASEDLGCPVLNPIAQDFSTTWNSKFEPELVAEHQHPTPLTFMWLDGRKIPAAGFQKPCEKSCRSESISRSQNLIFSDHIWM